MELSPVCHNEILFIINTRFNFALADHDSPESFIFHKSELKNYVIEPWEVVTDVSRMTEDDINEYIEKLSSKTEYKTPYAYASAPWNDWLGLEVDKKSFYQNGTAVSLAIVLREMTANGFTEKEQEEKRRKFEESVKELKTYTTKLKEDQEERSDLEEDLSDSLAPKNKWEEEENRLIDLHAKRSMIINHNRRIRAVSAYTLY